MFPYEDSEIVCLSVPREKKSPLICQYESYISKCYMNGTVLNSTETQKLYSLKKCLNWILTHAEVIIVSSI